MRSSILLLLGTAALAVAGCGGDRDANATANGTDAVKEAGDTTIAAGLDQQGQFFSLAQAAGLDQTLAGPGPYTVFVPADAAIAGLPAGTVDSWTSPEGRPELTRTLTYHILPGTVLAEDIGRAIDSGGGSAQLATMGGVPLTAAKEGNRIVLTDSAGGKASITKADVVRANGVVHETDAMLMPGE